MTRISTRILCLLVSQAVACSSAVPSNRGSVESGPRLERHSGARTGVEQHIPQTVELVAADHTYMPIDTPVLSVDLHSIYLDGRLLHDWSDNTGNMAVRWYPRVLGELMYLKALWLQVNPGKKFPELIGMAFDKSTPLGVLTSLVHTAGAAGFHDVMLYVRKRRSNSQVGAIHVYAWHPALGNRSYFERARYVSLAIQSPSDVSYVWYEGDRELGAAVKTTPNLLGASLDESFRRLADHRVQFDRRVNWVFLDGKRSLPWRQVVAVLDAVQEPRRTVRMPNGQLNELEAFDTILALDESEIEALTLTWKTARAEGAEIAESQNVNK